MRTTWPVILLALSLAANAAFYFQRGSAGLFSVARSPDSARSGTALPTSSAPGAAAAVAAKTEAAQFANLLAILRTGDLKTRVERLRAAGFSAAMIRSIIAAQVSERFSARRKALLGQQQEVPYWATQARGIIDPNTMSALRELNREQSDFLKELLGPDGVPDSDEMRFYQRRQFGDLAPDKLDQLQRIVSDYADLRTQVYTTANGIMLPEDREKLVLLEKEQRTDMAMLLTPQELENYELRRSSTASQLRSQLGTFKPTEEEFRAIFRAQRTAEEQYGSLAGGGYNPTQSHQIQAAVLKQAQAQLPPERYADFQQAIDPAYQMINRLVARLGLPVTVAPQVVTLQQDITQRATVLRSDQSFTTDQRNLQLAALRQEATTNLTNVLGGQRGFEAYKQYGGQWLQMLQPRPAPSPTSPPRG